MSSIKSLCHLLESLEWLTDRVRQLARILSTDPAQMSRFWREATSPIIDADGDMAASVLGASLSQTSVASLHDVVNKLEHLSDSCLILLRLEVRAQCLYQLLPTLRLSSYYCDAESVETDARVVALNKSLVAFDEVLSAALTKVQGNVAPVWACSGHAARPPVQASYPAATLCIFTVQAQFRHGNAGKFSGRHSHSRWEMPVLSLCARPFLCASSVAHAPCHLPGMQWIRRVNNNGIHRMSRNIFALQQTHQR